MSRKRSKKTKTSKKQQLELLETALIQNGNASRIGPKRKTWSTHDLKSIKPLTTAQDDMFRSFFNDNHICAFGAAGTGKTFAAVYLALETVLNDYTKQNKIMILRSAVPTRDIGFLPGDLNEKMEVYELPYKDIFSDMMKHYSPSTYDDMKKSGLIEFTSTSFIRGLTWDNSIIIIDEGENMTFQEISSILTRVGHDSIVIFLGDTKQTDLPIKGNSKSGMALALQVFNNMPEFDCIQFTHNDIVRSKFVKSWIIESELLLNKF